jgi:hypothetical protein
VREGPVGVGEYLIDGTAMAVYISTQSAGGAMARHGRQHGNARQGGTAEPNLVYLLDEGLG